MQNTSMDNIKDANKALIQLAMTVGEMSASNEQESVIRDCLSEIEECLGGLTKQIA